MQNLEPGLDQKDSVIEDDPEIKKLATVMGFNTKDSLDLVNKLHTYYSA